MLTSPFIVALRNATRKLGLNKMIGQMLSSRDYEDSFGTAICSQIRSSDTVWDIGANLGYYTSAFLNRVGPDGKVVAFEPVASCFNALRQRFENTPNVTLKNLALGDADGTITMSLSDDPLAATHQVVVSPNLSIGKVTQVAIRTATSVIHEDPSLFPNIVKIDVEGHEGAVIDGMQSHLADPRLRCVGVEIHFGLLNARGESGRPRRMEQQLKGNGFQLKWTDPSHLLALR